MSHSATRFDYHVHETYSSDARNATIPSYIEYAETNNIEEIAFTTHFIITGYDWDYGIQSDQIPEYLKNIEREQENTDIRLLKGLEIDYFSSHEKELRKIVEEHDFDFVLGSTHYINGIDIGSSKRSPPFFTGRRVEEAADEYFTVWKQAIESGLFDVMAHADYWKKNLGKGSSKPLEWEHYGSVVHEALNSLVENEVGIEVNTSGFRIGLESPYPMKEFLEAAYESGARIITLGSDSHRAENLGYRFQDGLELIKESGFTHLSRFKNRKRSSYPL